MTTPPGFVWINRPAIVSGEDFTYEATVLCSFPKSNGKVRFIVEDHGRIFIQRDAQIKYTDTVAGSQVTDFSTKTSSVIETYRNYRIYQADDDYCSFKYEATREDRSSLYAQSIYEIKKAIDGVEDPRHVRGCPHCGHFHPGDGMCV